MIDTPSHLGLCGAALYTTAATDFELSIPENAALLQAAETIDTLRIIEDAIRETGPVLPTGRPNPLLAEARQQRATLVRLLGLLDLRLDADSDAGSIAPASRAARAAARARWDKQRSRA